MREFNTSGPCDPALHYTVMRQELIAQGMKKVQKGRYITLFAPRQSGKTTYFQLLMEELKKENFLPLWISFEDMKTQTKEIFYHALNLRLQQQIAFHGFSTKINITNPIELQNFFHEIYKSANQLVLIIDEFEGIPDCVLNEIMHTFRYIYHQKENRALHSLLLVGVSTISELILSSASPFNISEELQIPYFSFDEVKELMEQHTVETEQIFEPDVIRAVYEDAAGQPGLTCAICAYMIENSVKDRTQPVTPGHYYITQKHFLTERFDKNIINIVQKAREKREFMLRVLFKKESMPFTVDDPDIAWLFANGVVGKSDGYVSVPVPLYAKRLINAFRPLINGETHHYLTSHQETINKYLNQDNSLNINSLLEEYRAYVRRRGFRAFDTKHLKEGAWHYSLDGFITFFIQCLEGQTFVEVPTGRGRTDILILHKGQKYIIETKRFVNNYYFQQGKGQLAEYLKSEGLSHGWYVVFSNLHTDRDELLFNETVQGRQIHTHIISIKFEQPSQAAVPEELKLAKEEQIALNMLNMENFTNEQIAQATGVSMEKIELLAKMRLLIS
ncbi:AAA-like domain-containing protein [Desulfobacterales bacterium HSG17]|nr:AAA-like domain-containing protein [Desulfobacterales bacterium HSG17]